MSQPGDLSNDTGAARLPRDTTPTWEVELLISGVAVFAMLQLPGLLDDLVFAWRPRFDVMAGELLWLLYVYAKSAALILAATFVLHLLLRAHWIALVGLHSIHPRGVDWSRLNLGPRAREIEARRMGTIEAQIERSDNRATTLFALGVILASFLVGIGAIVAVAMAVAGALATRIGLAIDPAWVALGFAALMVGYALANTLDRHIEERATAADRGLRALLRFYAALGMGAARSPGLALLSSHHGRRRVVMLIVAVMMSAFALVSASYVALREPDAFGSYSRFPQARDHRGLAVEAAHYLDRRNPARDPLVPMIQSLVVTGPYLQLLVPYDPRRDDAALRAHCPAPAEALACLQRLHGVRLDGRVVAGLAYQPSQDPHTDRPALLAMIDVRGLAPGRHELRIARAPRAGSGGGNETDTDIPDARIPFWR